MGGFFSLEEYPLEKGDNSNMRVQSHIVMYAQVSLAVDINDK